MTSPLRSATVPPEHLVDHLTGFVDDLRSRGIVIGPASLIDAG